MSLGPALCAVREYWIIDPEVTGKVRQVFTIERSAKIVAVTVIAALLLAGSGSGVVLLTLAVLTILPVTLLLTIPRINMSSVVPDVTVPRL
jgi:uncharacterized membrane protein